MADQEPRAIPGHPVAWMLLFMAALLRLYHLGHQSIWVDEYTSFLVAKPFEGMTWMDLWENLHGPLHAASVHFLTQWLGISVVTLRLPTAVAGVCTVAVIYRVAERALGRGGLVAASLACFSPFLIWYSQEARNYAFVILFATMATWAWVEILTTRRVRWWAVYVIACVLGVLSNLSMFFVIAAHAGHWLWLARNNHRAFRTVRPWILYVCLVAVAVSPWLWQLGHAIDWSSLYRRPNLPEPLRREVSLSWMAVPYLFFTFCLGFSMGPSPRELHASRNLPVFLPHLFWLIPAAIFFAALIFKGLRDMRRRPESLSLVVCWLCIPIVLALYVATRDIKVFNPRYVAVSLPALYLLWTEALLSFRRAWVRWLTVAALGGMWAVALFNHYHNPAYNKDDTRGAGEYVMQHWQEGDYLLTTGAAMPIRFYVPRSWPGDQFWLGYAGDTLNLPSHFRQSLPAAPRRVWVVSCRPHWYDPQDHFQRFLERTYPLLDRHDFTGCQLYLIRSDAPARPSAKRGAEASMPGASAPP